MPSFSFPEYLAANLGRAYPLAEFGPRLDVTGSVALPDCLLVDARLCVTPSYAGAGTFFVSRIELAPSVVSIAVSFAPADSSAARVIAVATIDPTTATFGDFVSVRGAGADESIFGVLTFGDLPGALSLLTGGWDFAPTSAPFESDAVAVGQPAVRAVELYNGDAFVGSFGDALRLVAGRNVLFTRLNATDVRLDAADGINVPTADACADAVAPAIPIRTINGVAPDTNGNFTIATDECLAVTPGDGGVTLADLCSKSCCGCDELAALVAGQQSVEALVLGMQARLTFINSKVDSMLGNVVAGLSS